MAEKKESAKSTREKAAEARAAAQAAERRRERMIRIIGGLAVLAVVVGIIAIGVLNSGSKSDTAAPDANSPLPTGVTADNQYGWQVNTAANKPNVEIYEDFQCPACANLEQQYGTMIQELAAANDIQLTYRPMTFLDLNLRTDHSVRAAGAFGCAINAGVGEQYHNLLFANQPANEGDGWTDEQLKQFGADAGLTGQAQTDFDQCVTDGTYKGWAQLSNEAAFARGVSGTPTIYINGKEMPKSALSDPETFKNALTNPAQ